MQQFFLQALKILGGVLIEKGLKPLFEYLAKKIELAKLKKENKRKVEKVKNAKNESDFDSSFDDMP